MNQDNFKNADNNINESNTNNDSVILIGLDNNINLEEKNNVIENKDNYSDEEVKVYNLNSSSFVGESVDNNEPVNIADIEVKEEKVYDLSEASISSEVGVSVDKIIENSSFNQVEDSFVPEPTLVLDENQEEVGKVVDKVEIVHSVEEQIPEATLIIDESGESRNTVDELHIAGLDRNTEKVIPVEKDVVPEGYEEELTKIYVGENYEEFMGKKINFSALIFSYLYLLYRKMFLLSFGSFIVCTIITILTDFWLVYLIPNIVFFFLFNYIYSLKIKLYLSKYKNKISEYRYSVLKKQCKNDGGISFSYLFLGTILFVVLIFGCAFLLVKYGVESKLTNIFDIIGYDVSNLYVDPEKEEVVKVFNGYLIEDSSVSINNIFVLNIDKKFHGTLQEHSVTYEYYCNTVDYSKCSFSLFSPAGFKNADDLVKQMNKYYSTVYSSEITKMDVNGIKWSKFYYSNSLGLNYVYVTSVKDKIYLLEYNIPNNADISCSLFNDNILDNISLK